MNESATSKPAGDLLVIGYGNTLRRDDGVGPRVAAAVEESRLAGVRSMSCHQLTPELAEPISRAGTVVFVDAAVNAETEVRLVRVTPAGTGRIIAHVSDPGALLAFALDVFGRCPPGWCLTIPIQDTAFGEELSPRAREGMRSALEKIRMLASGSQPRGGDPVRSETRRD